MSGPAGPGGLNLAKLVRDAFVNSQGRVLPSDVAALSVGQLLAMAGQLPGSRQLTLAEAIAAVNERRRRDGLPPVPPVHPRS